MTDPAPLCDDCGGTGETETPGDICPTCDGWGTHPEASITDEPPDEDELEHDIAERELLEGVEDDDDDG